MFVKFLVFCNCEKLLLCDLGSCKELLYPSRGAEKLPEPEHELARQIKKPWQGSFYFNIRNYVYY